MTTNENGDRRGRDGVLVSALGSGLSYAEAGKTVGLSKSTIARRMADPSFRARVIEEREANLDAARRALAAAAPNAIAVLTELSNHAASDAVRLGAARTMADLALGQRRRVTPGLVPEADVESLARDLAELALRHVPEEGRYRFAQEITLYCETGRLPR
jgi:hypothetical protein